MDNELEAIYNFCSAGRHSSSCSKKIATPVLDNPVSLTSSTSRIVLGVPILSVSLSFVPKIEYDGVTGKRAI
jgi:hypothetical protein